MEGMASFMPLILIFALMYFMLVRPQQKQKKKREELLNSLEKGEKVVTIGGIYGTITKLGEKDIVLEIAPNVRVSMQRGAVGTVIVEDLEEEESEDEATEKE